MYYVVFFYVPENDDDQAIRQRWTKEYYVITMYSLLSFFLLYKTTYVDFSLGGMSRSAVALCYVHPNQLSLEH